MTAALFRRSFNLAATYHRAHPWLLNAIALVALTLFSLWLRTRVLHAKFWIDEGISVGIAQYPFWEIPSVLAQDGAPPLYYLLLHLWIEVVGGTGEARMHALSVIPGVLIVPVAWWGARTLFGSGAGLAAAALAATFPFITYYSQETRMYSLVVLLATVTAVCFAAVFVQRRRRLIPLTVLFGAALVYTHNWGLFFIAAAGLAWIVLIAAERSAEERRALIVDGLIVFAAIAALYAPWVPTMLAQAAHTGAPWSGRPQVSQLVGVLSGPLSAGGLVAVTGLLSMRGRESQRARAALMIAIIALGTLISAWVLSQVKPAWSSRYTGIVLGPMLLLVGAGLVRMRVLGIASLLVAFVLWANPQEGRLRTKSNAFRVAHTLTDNGIAERGDTVIVIQPEQTPLMRYYLGDGLRWADALGPVAEPWVFDWRDALARWERIGPRTALRQIMTQVPSGTHVVAVFPIIRTAAWRAPWTALIRKRSAQWQQTLDHEPALQRIVPVPRFGNRSLPRGIRAVVYRRR